MVLIHQAVISRKSRSVVDYPPSVHLKRTSIGTRRMDGAVCSHPTAFNHLIQRLIREISLSGDWGRGCGRIMMTADFKVRSGNVSLYRRDRAVVLALSPLWSQDGGAV